MDKLKGKERYEEETYTLRDLNNISSSKWYKEGITIQVRYYWLLEGESTPENFFTWVAVMRVFLQLTKLNIFCV